MEPRIQYARTKDELNIAYYTTGDGPPLVLTPGGPTGNILLESQAPEQQAFYPALAAGRTLVRYDRRGTGLSDDTTEPVSLETSLLDLKAVADHLQLEAFSPSPRPYGHPSPRGRGDRGVRALRGFEDPVKLWELSWSNEA